MTHTVLRLFFPPSPQLCYNISSLYTCSYGHSKRNLMIWNIRFIVFDKKSLQAMSKIFRIRTQIPFRRMRYAVVSLLIRADDWFYRNLHSALYKLGFRRVAYQFQTYGLPHSALWLMKPFLVCLSVCLSVCPSVCLCSLEKKTNLFISLATCRFYGFTQH